MATRTITPAEYARLRGHDYAGPKQALLPQTQIGWPATHWMLRHESGGTALVPVNVVADAHHRGRLAACRTTLVHAVPNWARVDRAGPQFAAGYRQQWDRLHAAADIEAVARSALADLDCTPALGHAVIDPISWSHHPDSYTVTTALTAVDLDHLTTAARRGHIDIELRAADLAAQRNPHRDHDADPRRRRRHDLPRRPGPPSPPQRAHRLHPRGPQPPPLTGTSRARHTGHGPRLHGRTQ